MSPLESGFYVPTDSRDVICLKQNKKRLIIVTNNNGPLSVFR
jgi:hypothetical protein